MDYDSMDMLEWYLVGKNMRRIMLFHRSCLMNKYTSTDKDYFSI